MKSGKWKYGEMHSADRYQASGRAQGTGFASDVAASVDGLIMSTFGRAVEQAGSLGFTAQILRGMDLAGRPQVCLCLGPADGSAQSRYCIAADISRRRVIHQRQVQGPSPNDSRLETELAGLNETVLNTELGLFFHQVTQQVIDLLPRHNLGF